MAEENIMFLENDDKSYTVVYSFINSKRYEYIDSYNYYDIDVDKISLFKKVIMNILLDMM